jgi:hypothetical protein
MPGNDYGDTSVRPEKNRFSDRLPTLKSIGRGLLYLAAVAYTTGEHAVEMAKKVAEEYPLREYPENKDENIK